MSLVSYLAGVLIDVGLDPKTLAILTGVIGLGPALAWGLALRLWKPEPSVPDNQDR